MKGERAKLDKDFGGMPLTVTGVVVHFFFGLGLFHADAKVYWQK